MKLVPVHATVKTLVLAATAFAAIGGVAAAVGVIPGQDGTISACYERGDGRLRVVADPSECTRKEQTLSWNQRGPQGETGPRGAQGPRGESVSPGGGVAAEHAAAAA